MPFVENVLATVASNLLTPIDASFTSIAPVVELYAMMVLPLKALLTLAVVWYRLVEPSVSKSVLLALH